MSSSVASATHAPLAECANERVRRLEGELLKLPQVDLKTQTLLHGGMCARTILIPAGAALTGAVTNKANFCVMVGDITVTTDDGMRRLTGFHVIPAGPGFKRAGYAHQDTFWTTVWPTEAACVEDAEDEMTPESNLLQTRLQALPSSKPTEITHQGEES
jgi:hypothetical protein